MEIFVNSIYRQVFGSRNSGKYYYFTYHEYEFNYRFLYNTTISESGLNRKSKDSREILSFNLVYLSSFIYPNAIIPHLIKSRIRWIRMSVLSINTLCEVNTF